ncbi:hypothetical protein B0H19DRAFT_1158997 [Mycena capillaripes]|nr:hypothetical protein B0H19DRAFT_1158997 [Mycena capillaripes]
MAGGHAHKVLDSLVLILAVGVDLGCYCGRRADLLWGCYRQLGRARAGMWPWVSLRRPDPRELRKPGQRQRQR